MNIGDKPVKKSKRGRPVGSTNKLPPKSVAKLEALVNKAKEQTVIHKASGGRVHVIEGREYAVVEDNDNDPFITLEPPKKAGRPSKAAQAFEDTKIPLRRKEVMADIPSEHLKALRQLSSQNPKSNVWLDHGLGYFCNGTLFNRFSVPIGNTGAIDVKVSIILQGLVIHLMQHPACYQIESYLNEIGMPLKRIEERVKEHPEIEDALLIAKQICKERLIKEGFKEGKGSFAKFILQAEHNMTERKTVETTTLNVTTTSEDVEMLIQSGNHEAMMKRLRDMLPELS